MSLEYNRKLTSRAQELRKAQTKEEKLLWYQYLSRYHYRFRRQHPIGNFIVDFYCHQAKLVIELDGSQHFSEEGLEYDRERSAFLNGLGLLVVRIPNNEVSTNLSGVCKHIDRIVKLRI